LFLQKSDKTSAIKTGFGKDVPDATQISFNFGTSNMQDPAQAKSGGKIQAADFK
jgi:hypothetical protein